MNAIDKIMYKFDRGILLFFLVVNGVVAASFLIFDDDPFSKMHYWASVILTYLSLCFLIILDAIERLKK